MSAHESDGPEVSSHALHDLLADLNSNEPSHPSQLHTIHTPAWTFSAARSTSSPGPAEASNSTSLFPTRSVSRDPPRSLSDFDSASSAYQPAIFNTPNRSILSSGPPTASVSVNTAQASMSAPSPVNSSRPLSALTGPSLSTPRRSIHSSVDAPHSSRKSRVPRAEKDVDDPSSLVEGTRAHEVRDASTPTTLTRLFAAAETTSPVVSRHASYIRTPSGTSYTRASLAETAPLPHHLYNRGLLGGRHSDITVHAFGTKYSLHRILLDRSPFFASALSEPWFESSSKDITLQPEDIDSNITQAAFELALKRLYGCNVIIEEEKEAVGLFATGCWLEMGDLIESSVMSLLRQMSSAKLSSLIRLVTNSYYGKAGDRILASAKAMLCREGWEMPIKYWDGIAGDIVREIVGGDGFFVPGEWERWILAKRVLDRRLKTRAIEAGLCDSEGKPRRAPPGSINFLAIRFDTVYRKNSSSASRHIPEAYDPWLGLYTCPDVAALLVLLDEGIHYVHLSFEQLQRIRDQRDILGLPVMPERVIMNAQWMSMELRQKIVNAKDLDMELGLTQVAEESIADAVPSMESNVSVDSLGTANSKGKQIQTTLDGGEEDEMESGSWDGNGRPRKFWVPRCDATSVMGGSPDTIATAANGVRPFMSRHLSRFSASLDPQDVQWATDFSVAGNERPQTPGNAVSNEPTSPLHFTHYPPFRFSAEFPNPRALKEKKRVYSRTVWYAGSLWNVYVQKVETTKNTQLGIYLHRAKEREHPEELISTSPGSVNEHIGHFEREILTGRNGRRARRHQHEEARIEAEDEISGSGGDPDATLVARPTAGTSRGSPLSGLLRSDGVTKASQTPGTLTLSSMPDRACTAGGNESEDDIDELMSSNKRFKVSTLPPYVDGRPSIKTYFKIYSPSKGGRMLSVYESAPDNFNFSQSWGWRSSTMILDDGLLGYDEGGRSKDGRLRFMVVIGNV